MSFIKSFQSAAFTVLCFLGANTASATLFDRGGGLIYDDALNITWQQNANLAATNTFGVSGIDSSGLMNWYTAQSWIAAMNNANYDGYSDWRLASMNATSPAISVTDCRVISAASCVASGNELGYMYYDNLGGSGQQTGAYIAGDITVNGVTVQNVQELYWSNPAYDPDKAWNMRYFAYGDEGAAIKSNLDNAWAVRSGDVAAPIPEPETYAMLLAGLGLLGLMARRRKQ